MKLICFDVDFVLFLSLINGGNVQNAIQLHLWFISRGPGQYVIFA